MSEYWKSTPKYWCKHCSTYVKDTPFERRTHESTGKHQGNLKRFLRDIQNSHERGEREKEWAKAEVERLNKVVGGNTSSATSSIPNRHVAPVPHSPVRKTPPAPLTTADQKRQWTQLAEMGIQVPDDYRAELAMAGDWKTVSPPKPEQDRASSDSLSVGVRKRKLNVEEQEEQEEQEATEILTVKSLWGKSLRRYPGQSNDDLDDLLSGKTLKREQVEPSVKQESGHISSQISIDAPIVQRLDSTANLAEAKCEPIPLDQRESQSVEAEPELKALSTPAGEEIVAPVFKKRKSKAVEA